MQKKPLMRAVIAWLVVIALLAAAPVPAGAERPESPAAEASTEQEFRKAFQSFMEKGIYDFRIVVKSERLFESLKNKGRAFAYAAMYGADTLRVRTTQSPPYTFYLDEFQLFSVPWACVTSRDKWIRAVESMAQRNETRFTLVLDPLFAETLQGDESLVRQIEARCPMSEWKSSYLADYTRFEFSDVVFSLEPRIECETEAALTEAIRQMGASGISGFTLILPGGLFDMVSADDFSRLQALEADAGMSERELSYSPGLYTLTYAGAVIRSDAAKLASVQEAAAFAAEAVRNGEYRITLFCTPETYSRLAADPDSPDEDIPLGDALVHSGVFRYSWSCSRASSMINITVTELYPGTKIFLAEQKGDYSWLSARELETLAEARKLAEECRTGAPLETARGIHDALCRRITYVTDDGDSGEGDTAVGALLNGQADCDGYADAFFLAGSLAGLEVRRQRGYSRERGADENADTAHMWNLVRIDGTWRLVDVTWDDQDYGIIYNWFNLGADRACQSHAWDEKMSVPLLETTP